MTSNPAPSPSPGQPWGWALLIVAIAWAGLARVPLVLNAEGHLDSDLAVDGLTLIDALDGRWRWHYPATPFIGSAPVLLSYLQARAWGPGPIPLVSGGVVAYALVVAAAYWMNRRAFGASVAAWGLVPLAFASTGAAWLSGRVTGGHLLATAWHAGAFALLWEVLAKGGWRRSARLGLWCGFGLSIDSMFAVTWVGLGVAALSARMRGGATARPTLAGDAQARPSSSPLPPGEGPGVRGVASPPGPETVPPDSEIVPPFESRPTGHDPHPGPLPGGEGGRKTDSGLRNGSTPPPGGRRVVSSLACLAAFALAGGVGAAPRLIGQRVDPHDAYVGQFTPILRVDHLAHNAGILLLDCLPRLIAGHRLPGLQAEPDPSKLPGGPGGASQAGGVLRLASKLSGGASPNRGVPWLALGVAVASLGLFARSMAALVVGKSPPDPAELPIRLGLLASTLAVIAGFLAHPSVTDSDNYRYLVFLLVPWSSGFGLMMAGLASKGRVAFGFASLLALGFAGLMTVDSARWYARLGWVDSSGRPIRRPVDDPALAWLDAHPGVSTILGDYWDVYRLSYLTRGRVLGVPFPQYPNRFPENDGLGERVVIVRPGPFGPIYRAKAMAAGGREVGSSRGLSIVEWPGGMTP